MTPLAITIQPDGLVILAGDLTFATINKKTVAMCDFKKINQNVIIDFKQVSNSDSAGLALMIEWLKISKTAGKICQFRNIPAQLLTLAKLSGFDVTAYFSDAV